MDEQEYERVISLEDLWNIFRERFILMAAAALLAVAAFFLCGKIAVKPKYNSTATLYLLRQGGDDYAPTSTDYSTALNLVNDCNYMLKSHAVLDEVIAKLSLSQSYSQLRDMISTSNPSGTRILEVSVKAETSEEAKKIVDRLCAVAAQKFSDAVGAEQVSVYSPGTVEQNPCNTIGLTKYVLVGAAAAVLVYAVFLIIFMLDDKINTEDDVRRYLNLTVLATIPNAEDSDSRKKYRAYYAFRPKSGKESK